MAGFFKLRSISRIKHRETGEALKKLISSVGQNTPGSEWVAFKADPKAWLHKAGYGYTGPGAGPNGEIPASINIVPVYDTEDTMHVRIPFRHTLDNIPRDIPDDRYGTGEGRFEVFLARYFMRQCR